MQKAAERMDVVSIRSLPGVNPDMHSIDRIVGDEHFGSRARRRSTEPGERREDAFRAPFEQARRLINELAHID